MNDLYKCELILICQACQARVVSFLMIYKNGWWPLVVLGYFNVIKVLSQFSRQGALEPSSNSLLYPFLHFPIEILPLMLAPVIASCHGPAELLRGDWNIFKYCCSNFYVAPWVYHQKTWNLSLFRFCFVPCLPGSPVKWATKKSSEITEFHRDSQPG